MTVGGFAEGYGMASAYRNPTQAFRWHGRCRNEGPRLQAQRTVGSARIAHARRQEISLMIKVIYNPAVVSEPSGTFRIERH
jgi:hypothetical protein